jgi:hypothetical protein
LVNLLDNIFDTTAIKLLGHEIIFKMKPIDIHEREYEREHEHEDKDKT